jgi:hypothetical protein
MLYLSLPTYTMLSSNAAPPNLTPSAPSLLFTPPQSAMTPAPFTPSIVLTAPVDDHVHLVTTCKGHITSYDEGGPFVARAHWVVGCSSPPVILAVGLKVSIKGARGELRRIHSVKGERVRFIFRLHNRPHTYIIL